MVDDRGWKIFKEIVEEFLETASPVSSLSLHNKFKINLSPATIRIEMGELERIGFLKKPHVSGGRMPTDEGYKYFVEKILKNVGHYYEEKVLQKLDYELQKMPGSKNFIPEFAAKFLAKESQELGIFVDENRRKLVFSGMEEILQKPEFSFEKTLKELFLLLEALEEKAEDLLGKVSENTPCIFIGNENPFIETQNLSMIIKGVFSNSQRIWTGIIGPKRMNYGKNISLVNYVTNLTAKRI